MTSAHGGTPPRRALAGVAVLALTGAVLAPLSASADDGDRIAPGSPAPESKIHGNQISGAQVAPSAYFVELASEPTSLGGSLSSIRAERQELMAHAEQAGVELEIRSEFGSLWNGVSVSAAEGDLAKIAASDVVEAIYPVVVVDAPERPEATTIDPELFTAITMTGADVVQSELGFDGTGVRVGIIDTGIDIDHPDLGGNGTPGSTTFPTARVTHGVDLVGDDYNSDPSDPAYSPDPVPDANPDDCQGHGTHVAGIVGADGEVTGVAPGVTFGAYRVFGCDGSTESDVMLRAMERALSDGMDVVNMSIGSSFMTWAEYPTAQASDALAREGVVVVASIGNSGANGIYSAGAPGVGVDTIGVGSVDNTSFMANFFTDETGEEVPYTVGTPAPEPPTSGTSTAVAVAEPGTELAPACGTDPFSDEQEALIDGNWLLVQRGGPPGGEACSFYEKAFNGQAAGAAGVIIYNNAAGMVNPSVAGDPPITVPVVSVSQADGARLVAAALADGGTTLTWQEGEVSIPSPTGGLMSSFSSFGATADLRYKPDVSAPGGQIYSTYPLEIQPHATLSGTSMAAPHVAGAVALMLEADPDLTVPEVRTRLQNSAEQLPLSIAPTAGLEVVHRQGAGMIQVDKTILADVVIEPGLVDLGQQLPGESSTHTLTFTNTSGSAEIYDLSYVSAVATSGTGNDWGYYLAEGTAEFSAPSVTVPAGGSASVDVTITSPDEDYLFGGYVVATGTDSSTYTVPVGGASFDLQDVEVLADLINPDGTVAVEMPVLGQLLSCGRFLGIDCVDPDGDWDIAGPGTVFTMDEGDVPTALIHFEHQARAMDWEVFEADADGSKGASLGLVREEDYLARSASRNGISAYTWDGMVVTETGARERVPNGDYILEITITKASAWNDDREPGTEVWTSPVFEIAWAGTGLVDRPKVNRALGTDRYSTAAELAVENFEPGVGTVFVGSSLDFPDALSGAALAGALDAPVLLTRPDLVPAATRMALQTLAPERIVILGGSGAISPAVEQRLAGYAPVVERIAGTDRYATSAAVAAEYDSADVVFLAAGTAFADALSATAPAGVEQAPVLLTRPDHLPASVRGELDRLRPQTVVVVGGELAVSEQVAAAAGAYGADVVRISGADRYATSAAVAAEFFPTPTDHALLANGLNFPDALASGPVAAHYQSPVLLTRPGGLPASVLGAVVDLRAQEITIAGGYGAVSGAVQEQLEALVYP
ncbi:hypothetical protein GCM10009584_11510 [Ornithinimicrobium humiphilum]|uniref:Fn3 domain-containing protein n=1 Tax=Ornithinimicrobium humiphilum TaxID=125288 RepID=A0A543KJK1_9MICO|nr:cell wall-binding repeat-containing protein [Ornithinimicrobium humiphilum]TQM95255.1 Fn3 domain-containing protein [Ornithinimicrobium humiphilum]